MKSLSLGALLLLALSACGPQADAKTVAEVFLSARDVDDVDGAMPIMAPGVVMRAPNELEYRGPAQVRQWLQTNLAEYTYKLSEAPKMSGSRVTWRDNLYGADGSRWVGELAWDISVTNLEITAIDGRVLRGASGAICPRCPPGTRI